MRILILGGSGFIGSHVVEALLASGQSVRIFGRPSKNSHPPLDNVDYFTGDFSDAALLSKALEGVDSVVHMISSTVPSTSTQDPIFDIQENLVNSVQLFQLMLRQNVKRIIFFSSGGTIYGAPKFLPVKESDALNPICSYGVVKGAIERYLATFEHLYGLRPLIIRPSNPYGPRQGHHGVQGVVSTFMRKIMSNEKITIWGSGNITRDYIYIDDLVQFCRLAIESDETGAFNVGSGIGYSLNEIITSIETVTGKNAIREHAEARQFDVPEIVLDIGKARSIFEWDPRVNLNEGLTQLYVWMKKQTVQR